MQEAGAGSSRDSGWWASARSGAWSKNRGQGVERAKPEPEALGLKSTGKGRSGPAGRTDRPKDPKLGQQGWNVSGKGREEAWCIPSWPELAAVWSGVPSSAPSTLPASSHPSLPRGLQVSPLLTCGDWFYLQSQRFSSVPSVSHHGQWKSGRNQAMSPSAPRALSAQLLAMYSFIFS